MQRALTQVVIATHHPWGAGLQGEQVLTAASSQAATCIFPLYKI